MLVVLSGGTERPMAELRLELRNRGVFIRKNKFEGLFQECNKAEEQVC